MKSALTIILGLIVLMACALLMVYGTEWYYFNKYTQTPVPIPKEQLKEIWGEPEKEVISGTDRYLIRYEKGLFTTYLFEFDKKGKTVIAKFYDD